MSLALCPTVHKQAKKNFFQLLQSSSLLAEAYFCVFKKSSLILQELSVKQSYSAHHKNGTRNQTADASDCKSHLYS